jgi:hypothetical protein
MIRTSFSPLYARKIAYFSEFSEWHFKIILLQLFSTFSCLSGSFKFRFDYYFSYFLLPLFQNIRRLSTSQKSTFPKFEQIIHKNMNNYHTKSILIDLP